MMERTLIWGLAFVALLSWGALEVRSTEADDRKHVAHIREAQARLDRVQRETETGSDERDLTRLLRDVLRNDQLPGRPGSDGDMSNRMTFNEALEIYQRLRMRSNEPAAVRAALRERLLAGPPPVTDPMLVELRAATKRSDDILGIRAPTEQRIDALLAELDSGRRR